ncbi:MAG: DUF2442 domain-containing protein [Candidatus Symbiodolus clandestinus]
MPTLARKIEVDPTIIDVKIEDHLMHVILADGREVAVPIAWFPRLLEASLKQRNHGRLIGQGIGIHWPDIDEDISAEGILRMY